MNKTALNKAVLSLRKSIGRDKVITDPYMLDQFSRDETSDISEFPAIVVRATSVTDVSKTLAICSKYNIPAIPRGAGTGVTGGAIPVKHGLVLSVEQMNNIIEIDKENMFAVVEPGVITKTLQDAALEHGLMYPPDPASLDSCSIGGNLAEGAGGPRAVKYGTTKDYVTGLEFVLPNGAVINTGGKIVKNATGYNFIGILVGSEGTLAVITKIYLKLIPAPPAVIDLLIPFDSIDKALNIVPLLLQNRIIPSTIEFMEEDAIKLVKEFLKEEIPFGNAGAHLLIQIDGDSEDDLMKDLDRLNNLINTKYEIIAANTKIQKERLWKTRRSIRESIKNASSIFFGEDTVVPRSKVPVFIKDIKTYLNTESLRSIIYGHAGDGNVHINILKGDMNIEKWNKLVPKIKKYIFKKAIFYGGTLTGEHGIGLTKKNYLNLAVSKEGIELSKRIKAAFDPNSILNPGKIF
ncbi:MAG: FAD-binding protein [Spirochaetes bacterium]|nr:FAD-binding protein [Spirochaetota bacterium]